MNKWRCCKRDCDFLGTGTPNEFNGQFFCQTHDPRNNWVVMFVRKGEWRPTEVHIKPGESVKDAQDGIAEYAGENLDRLIYTVVRESDFRQYYRDILDRFFRK